jgi:hypothetical protein
VKQQRIVYIQKQAGKGIMGIGQTAAKYLVDGMTLPADRGGGAIGSMVLQDGLIYIRKVFPDGRPCRAFGSVAIPGNVQKALVADGVAFPAASCEGILFVDEEVADAPKECCAVCGKDSRGQEHCEACEAKLNAGAQKNAQTAASVHREQQDPPAAKPVQQRR